MLEFLLMFRIFIAILNKVPVYPETRCTVPYVEKSTTDLNGFL